MNEFLADLGAVVLSSDPLVGKRIGDLGEGGQCYVCKWGTKTARGDVVMVAVKYPKKDGDATTYTRRRAALINEFAFMRPMVHPCVLPVRSVMFDGTDPRLVLTLGEWRLADLVAAGDRLITNDKRETSAFWDSTARSCAMFGLIAGLAYIHQRGVIHRDIAASNVVVIAREGTTISCRPYLVDFGLSGSFDVEAEASLYGRPEVLPPEVLSQGRGTPMVPGARDVYALGFVLAQIALGVTVVTRSEAKDKDRWMREICDSQDKAYGEFGRRIAREGQPAVRKCWDEVIARALDENVRRRPSALELLRAARGGKMGLTGTDPERLRAAEQFFCRGVIGLEDWAK